jgi:hypothetical protein
MPVGCIIGLGSRGRKNRASPPIVGPLCNGVSLSEGPRGRRKSPGRRSEWKEVRRRGSPGCRDVVRDCTPATSIGRQTTLYLSKILEWVCERGPPNGAGTSSVGRGRPSTSRTSWPNSANYHPRFPYGPRVRRCPGLTRTRDTASKFRVRGASLRQLGRLRGGGRGRGIGKRMPPPLLDHLIGMIRRHLSETRLSTSFYRPYSQPRVVRIRMRPRPFSEFLAQPCHDFSRHIRAKL